MGTTCLVTGASGFIGRNLTTALARVPGLTVLTFDSGDPPSALERGLLAADYIYHLAGVSRPVDPADFDRVNFGLTNDLSRILRSRSGPASVIFASSTQAIVDNDYGRSKRAAEDCLLTLAESSSHPVSIYRLPNVFGKWSRPNHNSAIATFCDRLSRHLPIEAVEPSRPLKLVYIDEVVRCFCRHLDPDFRPESRMEVDETFDVTVGEITQRLVSLAAMSGSTEVPNVSDRLTRYLQATLMSFRSPAELAWPVDLKSDPRGWLFELVRSPTAGQVFVSRTLPGKVRGNHAHDSKLEKFCLIQGQGVIRLQRIGSAETIDYRVDDRQIRVVDIPPGYSHWIENTGDQEMLVLFWANEVFNPDRPDTHPPTPGDHVRGSDAG